MPKSKSHNLKVSQSPNLHCKLCGCADPLGPLPEHLSASEMRIIVSRLNLLGKEIANNICASSSGVAQIFNGSRKNTIISAKIDKYLLSIIRQDNHSTASAQSDSIKNPHAQL
jgi:hypothetical protein